MKEQAKENFTKAVKKLKEANEELFRPEEDVVSSLVCKNAQFVIENYLKGYLLQQNIDIKQYTTIEMLFEQCVKINPKFITIDLSNFQCKSHTFGDAFCNDVKKVNNCFDVADSIDTFFRQKNII